MSKFHSLKSSLTQSDQKQQAQKLKRKSRIERGKLYGRTDADHKRTVVDLRTVGAATEVEGVLGIRMRAAELIDFKAERPGLFSNSVITQVGPPSVHVENGHVKILSRNLPNLGS